MLISECVNGGWLTGICALVLSLRQIQSERGWERWSRHLSLIQIETGHLKAAKLASALSPKAVPNLFELTVVEKGWYF